MTTPSGVEAELGWALGTVTRAHLRAAQDVVGGGQAGLAVGYHLARRNRSFVILDASDRVGDSWRRRWPSLRLYSPAVADGLPPQTPLMARQDGRRRSARVVVIGPAERPLAAGGRASATDPRRAYSQRR